MPLFTFTPLYIILIYFMLFVIIIIIITTITSEVNIYFKGQVPVIIPRALRMFYSKYFSIFWHFLILPHMSRVSNILYVYFTVFIYKFLNLPSTLLYFWIVFEYFYRYSSEISVCVCTSLKVDVRENLSELQLNVDDERVFSSARSMSDVNKRSRCCFLFLCSFKLNFPQQTAALQWPGCTYAS